MDEPPPTEPVDDQTALDGSPAARRRRRPKERRWGHARSPEDAEFLERFESIMQVPLIISAVLPLVIVPDSGGWLGVLVGVGSWLVFLVDFVVHTRHLVGYRKTGFGRFDLAVVIVTAPWFLLPGAQAGRFVVVLRVARLARVVAASRGSRQLFERVGRVLAVAVGVVFVGSFLAYYAEHPVNPEFATMGDAIWWGVVTITTVGYGDVVPITATGRWAAFAIMVTGIAVLGVLAGSLSSFFRLGPDNPTTDGPGADGSAPAEADPSVSLALRALTAEVAALRAQVEGLTRTSDGGVADDGS